MPRWLTNRFRLKVGLFMLPLLLPIGGAAVDADFERPSAIATDRWHPLPAAATGVHTRQTSTPAELRRPSLRSAAEPAQP